MTKKTPNIGIIMLNTRFPRPVGDIGNLASYRYPAQIQRLENASVANIVVSQLADTAIAEVVDAAKTLEMQGASIITTSCGFLAPVQAVVQAQIDSPFIASSLSLMPFLRQAFGQTATVGVLTFDSRKLSPSHFNGLYDDAIHICGIEQGTELHPVISGDLTTLDCEKAAQDVLLAARALVNANARCILLECTNLSPYKQILREELGLPVFDLVDAIHWLADAQ